MMLVFFKTNIIIQNVVKKTSKQICEGKMEYLIHERLECCGGISKSEGHDQKLIMPIMSSHCRIVHIAGMYTHLMISKP